MGIACSWPRPSLIRAAFEGPATARRTGSTWATTRGFAKSNDTYIAHGASKRIWVFPLHRHARLILSSPLPHPDLPHQEVKTMTLTEADATALFARLDQIDDIRGKRGRRHAQRSLVATILCAVVSGAQGSTAISEWVQRLSPAMLRRLRCRRLADGRYERPSEATLRRMLRAIDIAQLERHLGDWLHTHSIADEPVALDGKTLRGSQAHGRARTSWCRPSATTASWS